MGPRSTSTSGTTKALIASSMPLRRASTGVRSVSSRSAIADAIISIWRSSVVMSVFCRSAVAVCSDARDPSRLENFASMSPSFSGALRALSMAIKRSSNTLKSGSGTRNWLTVRSRFKSRVSKGERSVSGKVRLPMAVSTFPRRASIGVRSGPWKVARLS